MKTLIGVPKFLESVEIVEKYDGDILVKVTRWGKGKPLPKQEVISRIAESPYGATVEDCDTHLCVVLPGHSDMIDYYGLGDEEVDYSKNLRGLDE